MPPKPIVPFVMKLYTQPANPGAVGDIAWMYSVICPLGGAVSPACVVLRFQVALWVQDRFEFFNGSPPGAPVIVGLYEKVDAAVVYPVLWLITNIPA